jgi:phage regulator Rha-like protein
MMMNNLITNKPSMTSLETPNWLISRHDSVKRTTERLVDARVIVQPPLVSQNPEQIGASATMVFRFTDEQGKRDSIIVVAQLSPSLPPGW